MIPDKTTADLTEPSGITDYNVLIKNNTMADIADAIRFKADTTINYKPHEMADAIRSIQTAYPNGRKWTKVDGINSSACVKYGDGIWVASDNNYGGLYYSEDGKSWTHSNITNIDMLSVCYSEYYNTWVAASNKSNKGLYYSEDGKAWAQSDVTTGSFTETIWFLDAGKKFVIPTTRSIGYYSSSGGSWDTLTNKNYYQSKAAFKYENNLLFSTDGTSLFIGHKYNSEDYYGINGHDPNTNKSPKILDATGGFFLNDGTVFAIVAYDDYLRYHKQSGVIIGYSFDTKNTEVPNPLCITNNGTDTYVVGTKNNGIYYHMDYDNLDGPDSWIKSNITSGTIEHIFNDGNFWMAYSNNTAPIYYSTDGKVWNETNLTGPVESECYIVHDNGIYIIAFKDGTIYYSIDGKIWTDSNMSLTNESDTIIDVQYANGIWICNATDGIYYSIGWELA